MKLDVSIFVAKCGRDPLVLQGHFCRDGDATDRNDRGGNDDPIRDDHGENVHADIGRSGLCSPSSCWLLRHVAT